MIGLDTNMLVRLFVDDDPDQARKARDFVSRRCTADEPGFVDRVALCEMIWVLARAHGFRKVEIARVIEKLLGSRDMLLEDKDLVRAALQTYERGGAGFADALIGEVNRARGCEATVTFDRNAAKLAGFVRVR